VDGVQAEDNVVVLELVDEHGDGVKLVILIRVHGSGSGGS
jgi:hypothetical protein